MSYKVGIVGATGAVGQELISLLVDRGFPFSEIRLFASSRSAGKTLEVAGNSYVVEEAKAEVFEGLDVAIFSASSSISRELGPEAAKRGCVVIDNSSAFRMDEDVPLIIPEINPDAAATHKGIIANPNCTTAVALMGLSPLHTEFGLKRVFASTYQAVSGSGMGGIRELQAQVEDYVAGKTEFETETYPHQIVFNVLPHVDSFLDSGYTTEEMKMQNEGRKILGLPDLRVSCTCVRVPVFRAHSVSIQAEFERPVSVDRAREVIAAFPGVELCDEPLANKYPMPADYSGKVECGVGRIRIDTAFDNGLSLWAVGDQLWKGAALNAVQIAELLHERNYWAFNR
ncbi:MAG: aspartate-semialdehyde dehydrogenase [Opitutaceae bacterium]|nr:aspartate-semialdehyde dehydrogenase [Opitutaceae bacterium]